jgi:hypothetical protein
MPDTLLEEALPPEGTILKGLHAGSHYLVVLQRLHTLLQPETYFEIGTHTGRSLLLSKCASIAVDPHFKIDGNAIGGKPSCLLFQMGSDSFFKKHSPVGLFGQPIDLAFLDGMHQYEFLLRDFYHTERFCRRNSVIVLHDCIPSDVFQARRCFTDDESLKLAPQGNAWAGDVWKTLLILKERRPDLRFHCFNAPPTGLVCITNLDPTNTYLSDNYFELTAKYDALDLRSFGLQRYVDSLQIMDTALTEQFHNMTRLFWL